MKQTSYKRWMLSILLVGVLAGCGGNEAATPDPAAAPTATPAATATVAAANAEQAASPLAMPESPLVQPASPLPAAVAATPAALQPSGPSITIAVPSDLSVITQLAQDAQAPEPQDGMAALSAVLYSPYINRIIPGTQFYLTPAINEDGQTYIPSMFVGPKEENGDVIGTTDEQGRILLDNVPPGNYYLAVWTVYNWPLAFGAQDDALPLLVSVEAGDQQDLGLLYVEWP